MRIKQKLFLFSLSMTLALAPFLLQGQVEVLSESDRAAYVAKLPALKANLKNDALKQHLLRAEKAGARASVNAIRTLSDVPAEFACELIYYTVDPSSFTQYLPDAYPFDGKPLGTLRILAARGEYEAGSFVVYPTRGFGKVKLALSEFKSADGKVLPAANLDLKLVKVWYQNKNAWYSYFDDTGLKLVPELLVNDEDLIKVDTKKVANYARVAKPDGTFEYHWISAPPEIDSRYDKHSRKEAVFLSMAPGFDDAPQLLPVTMNEGEFKQFFLTAHIPENTPPGLYSGEIRMNAADGGKSIAAVPVTIKVLPFILPSPKTYFNLEKDFIVFSYTYTSFDWFRVFNGGDQILAEKQFLSYKKNQVRHGENRIQIFGDPDTYEFKRSIELEREAGAKTDYVLAYRAGIPWQNNLDNLKRCAKDLKKTFEKAFPENPTVFLAHGDECPAQWFVDNRELFHIYQREGFRFWIAGNHQTFYKAGYYWDFFNISQPPENSSLTRQWNEIGNAWTAWYAQHHVGPENPAYVRREYGMAPYLANYSAISNYAHHLGPMNDLGDRAYKPMVFAYGIHNGELDTLAWEAFREGLDDIRYATLLKTLAVKAQKNPRLEIRLVGNRALQFFAEFDCEKTDLATARMEMIRMILELRNIMNMND